MNKQKPYGFDTLMVHAGYMPDKEAKSITVPIYQTTAYAFENTEFAKELFELKAEGNIYSRIMNPTNDVFEKRMAALEGGVGALAFASGHAAMFNAILNLADQGDEIVSSICIYGGAVNMFGATLKRLGIKVTFVSPNDLEAWEKAVTDKTKCFFVESIGNPNATIADIPAIAKVAHSHGIPLIVDATFATPYLQRPIELGADIVVHSATKYIGGHGTAMAGVVIDSGKFQYAGNKRFPGFNDPDPSYHGAVFGKDFGEAGYITRLRSLLLRDVGACLPAFSSFLMLQGLETLSLRMQRHCENAQRVAEYLANHPRVSCVNYAGLPEHPQYGLAQKVLPRGVGSIFSIELDGSKKVCSKFIDGVELLSQVANVGDVRSLVTHPASTTHSQLTPEQLRQSGITEQTIRLSIGIEDVEDIIADFEQAIEKAFR